MKGLFSSGAPVILYEFVERGKRRSRVKERNWRKEEDEMRGTRERDPIKERSGEDCFEVGIIVEDTVGDDSGRGKKRIWGGGRLMATFFTI